MHGKWSGVHCSILGCVRLLFTKCSLSPDLATLQIQFCSMVTCTGSAVPPFSRGDLVVMGGYFGVKLPGGRGRGYTAQALHCSSPFWREGSRIFQPPMFLGTCDKQFFCSSTHSNSLHITLSFAQTVQTTLPHHIHQDQLPSSATNKITKPSLPPSPPLKAPTQLKPTQSLQPSFILTFLLAHSQSFLPPTTFQSVPRVLFSNNSTNHPFPRALIPLPFGTTSSGIYSNT